MSIGKSTWSLVNEYIRLRLRVGWGWKCPLKSQESSTQKQKQVAEEVTSKPNYNLCKRCEDYCVARNIEGRYVRPQGDNVEDDWCRRCSEYPIPTKPQKPPVRPKRNTRNQPRTTQVWRPVSERRSAPRPPSRSPSPEGLGNFEAEYPHPRLK